MENHLENGCWEKIWAAQAPASGESVVPTTTVDAKEDQDKMSADVPNANAQENLNVKDGETRMIKKITGVLVDLMVETAPEVHGDFVVSEKENKALHGQALKALWNVDFLSFVAWEI